MRSPPPYYTRQSTVRYCLVHTMLLLLWCLVTTLVTLSSAASTTPTSPAPKPFKLVVLHNNDMHARVEQTDAKSGRCNAELVKTNQCYGGFARVAQIVKQIKKNEQNVLYLNAGDTYQGTIWYTVLKWPVFAKLVQLLSMDAMSLGNHEFDDGVEGLAPFLSNITVPVVGANLQLEREPRLAALIKPSTVLSVGGRKVGVIGYLLPDTKDTASTGQVVFADEVSSIQREATRLKAQGVHILIALGHSGYGTDKKIAKEVTDIDLVIGGHTNTFLYTGKQPDAEQPADSYPTLVTQASGRKVPVVSAYAYTKYMGRLDITFGASGEMVECKGNPILLDHTIPQDVSVLAALQPWSGKLTALSRAEVGRTRVFLNGSHLACRMGECNLGNLVTDAYVLYNSKLRSSATTKDRWIDATIGVQSSGSIRTSIDYKSNNGSVSMEDVIGVVPFDNVIARIEIRGRYVREMLEYNVRRFDITGVQSPGEFLQLSGLQVTYDVRRPAGQRVTSLHVLSCTACRTPQFEPLLDDKTYGLLTTAYIADGGDGFRMLKEQGQNKVILDSPEADIVADYFKQKSPVNIGLENRIKIVQIGVTHEDSSDGANTKQITSICFCLTIFSIILSNSVFF